MGKRNIRDLDQVVRVQWRVNDSVVKECDFRIVNGEKYVPERTVQCCCDCTHFGDTVNDETYCTLHSHKAKPHDFCSWWEDGR